nr:hypothetical protein CFP56_32327 [Quercus suber]
MRRPKPSTLISANILPKECCKYDRTSGEIVWGNGVAGALIERKRKVEREQLKEKMRVWLERKASQIGAKRKIDGGVGVMVWRFSKKMKLGESKRDREVQSRSERPKKEKVSGLKRFWEGISISGMLASLTTHGLSRERCPSNLAKDVLGPSGHNILTLSGYMYMKHPFYSRLASCNQSAEVRVPSPSLPGNAVDGYLDMRIHVGYPFTYR